MTMPDSLDRPTTSTDPVADARQRILNRITAMFEESIRLELEISTHPETSADLRTKAKDHLSRTRSLLTAVQQGSR